MSVIDEFGHGFLVKCAERGVPFRVARSLLEKSSGFLSLETLANMSILSDESNRDVIRRMEDPDYETVSFKRKRRKGRGGDLDVSFDGAREAGLTCDDMRRLSMIARKVVENRKEEQR